LDESLSFGTLGSRCCGVTDYYNVPSSDVEIIAGSLSNSLGTAGGFCAGDKNIIDHQVLSSQAYCYSASLPAFLAAGAIVSLQKLAKNGQEIAFKLTENIKTFRNEFSPYPPHMELSGSNISPLLYLAFNENFDASQDEQSRILKNVIKLMKEEHKVLLTMLKTVEKDEKLKHRPMIKIAISAGYTTEQIAEFAAQLREITNFCVKN
jgi:serine palmitoyltransferase